VKDYKKYLSEEAANNVTKWLEKKKYQEYKPQLLEMIEAEKWQELEDAFFKVIEFGTGGRRGTTGIGSNRINKVTIGESAQALCSYIEKFEPEAKTKGIAVVCDTRLSSPELSRYVAEVVSGNGFKTYVYDGFRSTPQLSRTGKLFRCPAP
jgi:phosphoglucomutase